MTASVARCRGAREAKHYSKSRVSTVPASKTGFTQGIEYNNHLQRRQVEKIERPQVHLPYCDPRKERHKHRLSKALPVRSCTTHFSLKRVTKEEKQSGNKSKSKTKNCSHLQLLTGVPPSYRRPRSTGARILRTFPKLDTVVVRVPAYSSTVVANALPPQGLRRRRESNFGQTCKP